MFSQGRKFVRPGVVLIAAPSTQVEARLGLALAKRRIARSVDRNRIKRVVRESFRHARSSLGPVDIVVLARSRSGELSNRDLFGQLAAIWPDIATMAHAGSADRARTPDV